MSILGHHSFGRYGITPANIARNIKNLKRASDGGSMGSVGAVSVSSPDPSSPSKKGSQAHVNTRQIDLVGARRGSATQKQESRKATSKGSMNKDKALDARSNGSNKRRIGEFAGNFGFGLNKLFSYNSNHSGGLRRQSMEKVDRDQQSQKIIDRQETEDFKDIADVREIRKNIDQPRNSLFSAASS